MKILRLLLLSFAPVIFTACITQVAVATPLYPYPGQPNPTTCTFMATNTGDIIAYFAGSNAEYKEKLGMMVNGILTSAGFGLYDKTSSIGEAFNLGHVNAGDTLVFVVDVFDPDYGFIYSDPSLNGSYDINGSKGHNHIYSVAYTAGGALGPNVPSGTYVAFEDQKFPTGDFNYYNETYVFTNVTTTPTTVPEPTALSMLGAGLLTTVLRCRHKN